MAGNWFKTSLLMAAIVALFRVVGAAFGGAPGVLAARVLSGAMNFFAYWFSDKRVFSTHLSTQERVARLQAMAR